MAGECRREALPRVPDADPILEIDRLTVAFGRSRSKPAPVLSQASLSLRQGEILAVVGESGSGKTMLARAVLGLLPPHGQILEGSIRLGGESLLNLPAEELRRVRGARVGMVFQEPMSSLNPALKVGRQLMEGLRLHTSLSVPEIRQRTLEMLRAVRLPDAEGALHRFPHEFSGGMRQRIMLASAMLLRPEVLIADEPTSALDSLVQKEVMDLVVELTRQFNTAVILITHDLSLAAAYADRMAVICRGEIQETGSTADVLRAPEAGYTRTLLESLPQRRPERGAVRRGPPLLVAKDLVVGYEVKKKIFWQRKRTFNAVNGVSLAIREGATYALVGESGSGKTTLGRALVRDLPIHGGKLTYADVDITESRERALRPLRRDIQFIFQDPQSSLDPRKSVRAIIEEGLTSRPRLPAPQRLQAVEKLLADVGLEPEYARRLPHQLSGGQRQRVGIARSLAVRPRFVVADEPVSALDVTVQARILDLLVSLQNELQFALLFVTHDLSVVERIAEHVLVMYRGRIVESGPTLSVLEYAHHPYTRALIAARPRLRATPDGGYELQAPHTANPVESVGTSASSRHFEGSCAFGAAMTEVRPEHFVCSED